MDDSKFNGFIDRWFKNIRKGQRRYYNNFSLAKKVRIKRKNKELAAIVNTYCDDLKKKPLTMSILGDFTKYVVICHE